MTTKVNPPRLRLTLNFCIHRKTITMRIIIAGQTYYPGNNGQAIFSIRLAEGLAQVGHTVAAIVPSTNFKTTHTVCNGVNVLSVLSVHLKALHNNVYMPVFIHKPIRRFFQTFKPDVIHIQDHYPLSRTVLKIAKELGLPIMGTNHFLPQNILRHLPIPDWGANQADWLLWQTMLDVYRHLDFVTTPTETAAQILRRQNLPVPVQAVSCGVNLSRFSPHLPGNRADIFQRYHLDPQKITLLYVGRIDPEKEIDTLIQAVYHLHRSDVQLAIVGQGNYQHTLQTLIRNLGMEDQVIFTGYLPADDLPVLLNHIDIFAMPSKAELQSIATLEAMASAKPILAANACALPELVEDGYNGYLFAAGNSQNASQRLAQLIDEQSRWVSMGRASLVKVQPHTLNNTIKNYEMLYYKLLPETHPAIQSVGLKRWAIQNQ